MPVKHVIHPSSSWPFPPPKTPKKSVTEYKIDLLQISSLLKIPKNGAMKVYIWTDHLYLHVFTDYIMSVKMTTFNKLFKGVITKKGTCIKFRLSDLLRKEKRNHQSIFSPLE